MSVYRFIIFLILQLVLGSLTWASEQGSLKIHVFNQNQPAEDIKASIQGEEKISNKLGFMQFDMKEGIYRVRISNKEKLIKEFETSVVGGKTTSVTFHRIHQESIPEIFVPEKNNQNTQVVENKKHVNVEAKPKGLELDEFVVVSPKMRGSISSLLEVRKNHKSVADVMGSEQIARSGDGDAGASLRRVTGISLVEGKYIYVRGLGERYSSTMLNGVPVPSPDPARRVVPLDLFPAGIIENMVVQKSYSADLPGEFGGGSIQIKTKSIPDSAYFKASVSLSAAPGGRGLKAKGGGKDNLGLDDGTRAMPREISQVLATGKSLSALDPSERRVLGKAIRKSYNLEASDGQLIPNISVAAGSIYKLSKWKIGYSISGLYGHNWGAQAEESFAFNNDGQNLILDSQKNKESSNTKVKLGSLWGVGLKRGTHIINYRGMWLDKTTENIQISEGINSEKENFRKTEILWRERRLKSNQLSGQHGWKKQGQWQWQLDRSQAFLYEPDTKMYTYKQNAGKWNLETENGSSSNRISWNEMPEQQDSLSLKWTKVFMLGSGELKWSMGYNQLSKEREYHSHNFYYQVDASQVDTTQDPDHVFSSSTAELYQQANQTDNYNASQSLRAIYTDTDIPILAKKLNLQLGLRGEESHQRVESFQLFGNGSTATTLITEDIFPTLGLTYLPANKMKVRLGYSESISRPDFREISQTEWTDFELDARFKGNSRLQAATIKNIDARWEWYPNRGESFSLGLYQKEFSQPIEAIFGSIKDDGSIVGTTETKYAFINIEKAISRGIETEFRKNLAVVGLNRWTLASNFSLIESLVNIPEEKIGQLTSKIRPLQGQSPYIANFQLEYDSKGSGLKATILYNILGRRITGVGVDKRPDEYQEDFSQLDFVMSGAIKKNYQWKVQFKNILNPEIQRTIGQEVTRSYRRGPSFSLGFSAQI